MTKVYSDDDDDDDDDDAAVRMWRNMQFEVPIKIYTPLSLPTTSEANIGYTWVWQYLWLVFSAAYWMNFWYSYNNVNILKYSTLFLRNVRKQKCIWHRHKSSCTIGDQSYTTGRTRGKVCGNQDRKQCQILATPLWADGKRNCLYTSYWVDPH
jgi:hypothetical protein